MRDEFRRDLRARLMREAAVTLAPKSRDNAWTAWLRATWTRPAMRPSLAVALAAIVLIASAGSASADSVPGDLTYGLKRAIEEVRVALTFDGVERVRVLAELADERLAELEQVANRDDKSPTASEEYALAVARFRAAVDALQQAAPEDKSDAAQDVADAAREKHEIVLEQLRERLPDEAKHSVDRATEEEQRDTPNTKEKKDKGEAPDVAPRANPTPPRGGDRTTAPRVSPPGGRP